MNMVKIFLLIVIILLMKGCSAKTEEYAGEDSCKDMNAVLKRCENEEVVCYIYKQSDRHNPSEVSMQCQWKALL